MRICFNKTSANREPLLLLTSVLSRLEMSRTRRAMFLCINKPRERRGAMEGVPRKPQQSAAQYTFCESSEVYARMLLSRALVGQPMREKNPYLSSGK